MSKEGNYKYRKCEELLSPSDLLKLSPRAARLYGRVWNILAYRNVTETWANDSELLRGAMITPSQLPFAQHELLNAGLLEITFGTVQTHYRFIEDLPSNTQSNHGAATI